MDFVQVDVVYVDCFETDTATRLDAHRQLLLVRVVEAQLVICRIPGRNQIRQRVQLDHVAVRYVTV